MARFPCYSVIHEKEERGLFTRFNLPVGREVANTLKNDSWQRLEVLRYKIQTNDPSAIFMMSFTLKKKAKL